MLVGLALAGYGLLVLLRVLPHDAPLAGALSLGLGLFLLARGLPTLKVARARLVGGLGLALMLSVIAYNLWTRSDLGGPEWGLLGYGAALAAAGPFLDRRIGRTEVGSLVGWSFPLLLAPLLLFAANAAMTGPSAGAAASPLVRNLIVIPTAAGLELLGTPVRVIGSTIVLPTDRGSLSLGVGLVCAGLYPMVLFGGLVGLYAWREKVPRGRVLTLVAVGLLGLWVMNLVRLVLLAKIGQRWGSGALQQAHANLGWILFALYMVAFWAVVLRPTGPKRMAKVAPQA